MLVGITDCDNLPILKNIHLVQDSFDFCFVAKIQAAKMPQSWINKSISSQAETSETNVG